MTLPGAPFMHQMQAQHSGQQRSEGGSRASPQRLAWATVSWKPLPTITNLENGRLQRASTGGEVHTKGRRPRLGKGLLACAEGLICGGAVGVATGAACRHDRAGASSLGSESLTSM